jgi:hypothetical protein
LASGFEGQAALQAKLVRATKQLPNEVASALYTEALIIEKNSRGRTPVDTGALRASHETSRPEISGDEISVTISVGGPAVPYAIKVHDDVEMYHKVGESQFLLKAVLEAAPKLANNLARRIDLSKVVK